MFPQNFKYTFHPLIAYATADDMSTRLNCPLGGHFSFPSGVFQTSCLFCMLCIVTKVCLRVALVLFSSL